MLSGGVPIRNSNTFMWSSSLINQFFSELYTFKNFMKRTKQTGGGKVLMFSLATGMVKI